MYIKIGGRQNGKTYKLLCERINELELRIEFARKFGLSYKNEEQELNTLYEKLDGGENRVKEEPSKTTKQTSNTKNKNTKRRLF